MTIFPTAKLPVIDQISEKFLNHTKLIANKKSTKHILKVSVILVRDDGDIFPATYDFPFDKTEDQMRAVILKLCRENTIMEQKPSVKDVIFSNRRPLCALEGY